jgi:hypothetical protein
MCNNETTFRAMLSGGGEASNLIFRNIDTPPFTAARVTASTMGDWEYLMVNAYYKSTDTRTTSIQTTNIQILLETVAPYQSGSLWLDTARARDTFKARMLSILKNSNAQCVRAVLESGDLEYIPEADRVGQDFDFLFQAGVDGNVVVRRQSNIVDTATLSLPQAMTILSAITTAISTENTKINACVPIILAIIAVAKRGSVTGRWINRFFESVPAQAQFLREGLTPEAVRATWTTLSSTLTDNDIEAVIAQWVGWIPTDYIRLRVTLMQASGSGLTPLDTMYRVVVSYPSFPWGKVQKLFPEEIIAVQKGFMTVGQNRYYGFRKSLGAATSTQFRNIAWVAKEILLRLG